MNAGRAVRQWLRFATCVVAAFTAGCGDLAWDRADLVFLNGSEPETLDPAGITGQPEGRLANSLFEGLMAFDKTGTAGPGVAERWEISEAGKRYTFYLRNNARWSNGDPVTAHDFVSSWVRTLTPATASEYSYQLHYIKNGRAFNEGAITDPAQLGVRAVDDHTLVVDLENPTAFFLDLCAFTTLLPVHVKSVEALGDDWTRPGNLISNGAYMLTHWRLNDRLRLEKNPHYWAQDRVRMETIDVLPISHGNTAFNFYVSGRADLMLDKNLVPPALLDALKERDDFHSAPFLGTYFLRFNATRPPFDDPRVRMAFALVVNRDSIVEKITRAGELTAYSLVPPGTAGYEPPDGPRLDLARARALLAEAGFPDGKGFPRVDYLYTQGELNQAVAVELQAMFRQELGITMELKRQEWKVYLNSMSGLNYDIARSSWIGDYNDPNTYLDMFVTDGGNNRTGWADARYDTLIAQAAAELDEEKRFALFHEAERILISEQAVVCPLYFYVGIQLYDPKRLGGIEANLLDEHPLKEMYWKE